MACISTISNDILGWWASRNDNMQSVPNYEGYLHYMDAREMWKIDDSKTLKSLIASISRDTTFTDSHFLLTELYTNKREFELRDSMINVIRNGGTPRVDGAEAKRSLALILGVYESAKNGGMPVHLS